MDLLTSILSAVLVWGVIGVGIATAWNLGRAIATRNMRRHKWSAHSAHVHLLTDTMVHYRPNIRAITRH
jgi:hypothetical protein